MNERQLTDEGYRRAAKTFKLLADPTRLRLLDILRREGPMTVGAVGDELQVSQPTASRQLGTLFDAGILGRRREEHKVFYFIEDHSVFSLCEAVCGRLERESTHQLDRLFDNGQELFCE